MAEYTCSFSDQRSPWESQVNYPVSTCCYDMDRIFNIDVYHTECAQGLYKQHWTAKTEDEQETGSETCWKLFFHNFFFWFYLKICKNQEAETEKQLFKGIDSGSCSNCQYSNLPNILVLGITLSPATCYSREQLERSVLLFLYWDHGFFALKSF